MAQDGNGGDPLARLEKLEDIAAALLEHARLADKRLDVHERQIETLHTVAKETNERIAALVAAIGAYIRSREGD